MKIVYGPQIILKLILIPQPHLHGIMGRIIFKRTIKLDKEYMFEIKQTVINNSNEDITLYPYASINRKGFPKLSIYILHEGLIGVIENRLQEVDYDDLEDTNEISELSSSGGWIGITDKYWLAALIPNQDQNLKDIFRVLIIILILHSKVVLLVQQ